MSRSATGWIQEKHGKFVARLRDEDLGSFDTESAAQRALDTALRADDGLAPDAFSEFGDAWMSTREADFTRRKRSKSFSKERSVWNSHIVDAPFWDLPVRRITPKIVQAWVGDMFRKQAMHAVRAGKGFERIELDRTVSRRVVEQALKYLKLCLDAAVIEGKLRENPARLVKLPRAEPDEIDGELIVHLSVDEIDALFALQLPLVVRAIFAVAIYVGLRSDELWGLRRQDIVGLEGSRPTCQVRRSYDGPVKTKNALRDVPILPPAVNALRAYFAASPVTRIGGLVFPGRDGSCHAESYTAQWRDSNHRPSPSRDSVIKSPGWRRKAGIRPEVDFRDFRHTCGCHLAQGTWTRPFTLHEIKRWLGHSSISVTERHYAMLTSDNLHAAVASESITGYKREAKSDHMRK